MKKLCLVAWLISLLGQSLFIDAATENLAQQSNPFVLITMLYNESNKQRACEYLECLDRNLKHPDFGKIHVLYDISKGKGWLFSELEKRSVAITFIKGHASFGSIFKIANAQYPHRHIILSNADIYFDESLHLIDDTHLHNTVLALSRLNPTHNGFKLQIHLSQDVWIFKTPLPTTPALDTIHMGTWCCEGLLALQLEQIGLRVANPCLTVSCFHMHAKKIRHWKRHDVIEPRKAPPHCTLPLPGNPFNIPDLIPVPPYKH